MSCKTSKDCIGKEWYSYSDVRFCKWQVLWVLSSEIIKMLRTGTWPPAPNGSGYIDPQIKTGYGHEGYFVKAIIILAVVESRLKLTKKADRKRLRFEIRTEEPISNMQPEALSALFYIANWRPKKMTYTDWKKQRTYRGKND